MDVSKKDFIDRGVPEKLAAEAQQLLGATKLPAKTC